MKILMHKMMKQDKLHNNSYIENIKIYIQQVLTIHISHQLIIN